MDKPYWIELILRDEVTYNSFLESIDTYEALANTAIRDALVAGDTEKARVCAGESSAWQKLRQQVQMYRREEEHENGTIR